MLFKKFQRLNWDYLSNLVDAKIYKTILRFLTMAIVTPNILPGEKGYVSKKEKTAAKKVKEKIIKTTALKKEMSIGHIKTGYKAYRIGRPSTSPRGERKYPVWRYSRKIGEIVVRNKDSSDESITLTLDR